MSASITVALTQLFQQHFGKAPEQVLPLTRTASGRQYFRLVAQGHTYIGTYGPDAKENEAFISFSRHFHARQLCVPEIYAVDMDQGIYLQEDLGTQTLFHLLSAKEDDLNPVLIELYKKVLEQLAHLQIRGGEGLDYNKCTPRSEFDRQSMSWDLNYFKYFFLRLIGLPFDEAALEADFDRLITYLLQADRSHFMFRDFQSRNIMIRDGQPWFVDYQGGRRGPLQYDLASLLYQPAATIAPSTRELLLDHYLDVVSDLKEVDREGFLKQFYGYVLIRRLQALGTYGLRGIHERYTHFLGSIPIALKQLNDLFETEKISVDLPEIARVLKEVQSSGQFEKKEVRQSDLTVTVSSFSYKQGLPADPSGNGGGFVFDCRFLNNPGRHEAYKKLTGRDRPVIDFLHAHSNIRDFLNNTCHIVDEAVEDYLQRGFTHLMVSFGCTGGQHRSVMAADLMAQHLTEKYPVKVVLQHIVQEKKGWVNE